MEENQEKSLLESNVREKFAKSQRLPSPNTAHLDVEVLSRKITGQDFSPSDTLFRTHKYKFVLHGNEKFYQWAGQRNKYLVELELCKRKVASLRDDMMEPLSPQNTKITPMHFSPIKPSVKTEESNESQPDIDSETTPTQTPNPETFPEVKTPEPKEKTTSKIDFSPEAAALNLQKLKESNAPPISIAIPQTNSEKNFEPKTSPNLVTANSIGAKYPPQKFGNQTSSNAQLQHMYAQNQKFMSNYPMLMSRNGIQEKTSPNINILPNQIPMNIKPKFQQNIAESMKSRSKDYEEFTAEGSPIISYQYGEDVVNSSWILNLLWPNEQKNVSWRGQFCFKISMYKKSEEGVYKKVLVTMSSPFSIFSKPTVFFSKLKKGSSMEKKYSDVKNSPKKIPQKPQFVHQPTITPQNSQISNSFQLGNSQITPSIPMQRLGKSQSQVTQQFTNPPISSPLHQLGNSIMNLPPPPNSTITATNGFSNSKPQPNQFNFPFMPDASSRFKKFPNLNFPINGMFQKPILSRNNINGSLTPTTTPSTETSEPPPKVVIPKTFTIEDKKEAEDFLSFVKEMEKVDVPPKKKVKLEEKSIVE
eukprot:gene10765-3384_t